MDISLRQVDLTRLENALTTVLSPLAHERCDDWRLAVEASVGELLDGDHVVFGIPRAGVPMHVHSTNVAALPQLAIQTLFGSGRMARDGDGDLARLRTEVTSKGGTTEAALRSFEAANLRGIVAAALTAATDRSREMAQAFGNSKKS